MGKISFSEIRRGSGDSGVVSDEIWKEWNRLDNGEIKIKNSQIILISTDNQKYVAEISDNQYMENYEVYTGGKSDGSGWITLIRRKEANRRDEFILLPFNPFPKDASAIAFYNLDGQPFNI